MSLMVWLPLNGSLENKGACETTTAVTSTQTWVTTGKIGAQSLYTKTRQTTMYFPQLVGTTTYSVAYWLYIPSATAPTAWADMFGIGFVCGSNTYYERDERREANTAGLHGYHMAKDPTAGSTTNGYLGLGNRSAAKDTWAHYVLTKDDTSSKLYENGVLVITVANSNFENTPRTMTGNVYLGDSGCEAYLNDFRIYNHCLSPAEVHEISQGLVLHYKLDDLVNSNLLTGNVNTLEIITLNQCTAVIDDGGIKATINSTSGDRRFYYSVSNVWKPTNSTFTVSFEAKAATDGLELNVSRSNITTDMIHFNLTTEWRHYSGQIVNTAAADGGTLSFQCLTNGGIFWVKNAKLERGAIETRFVYSGETANTIVDSSGYGYNGIIVGNPILTTNSPRYNACMEFNGTDSAINCGRAFNVQQAQACTWTGWFYLDSWRTSGWQYLFSSQEGGGILLGKYDTCTVRARAHVYTAADLSTSAYSADANYAATEAEIGDTSGWHMITGVYTPSAIKLYIDGVLKKTATTTNYGIHFNTGANMYVAAESAGSTPNPVTKCKVSDIRIYYTALSDADIKALYEICAKVDNKGNIHCYEFQEGKKEAVEKTGIITAHQISEFFPNLHYDKDVYVEPDGSLWLHIAHHNNPTNAQFSSNETWETGVYLDADRWYDIEQNVNNLSAYEFLVKQKTTSDATEVKYRWIQTVSPLTATYDDIKPASVTRITTSGYTDGSNGGIKRYSNTNYTRMHIVNSNSGNCFGAFGAWDVYKNGIPGYPNTVITTGYMDLYVRIDNINLKVGAKILKNSGINANNLIEI